MAETREKDEVYTGVFDAGETLLRRVLLESPLNQCLSGRVRSYLRLDRAALPAHTGKRNQLVV